MNRPKIITALPVAFDRSGRLDPDGTGQIAAKAANSGVDGVLALGTTGEFVSLDFEERAEVIERTLAECRGLRTIIHVGGASRYEMLRLVAQAQTYVFPERTGNPVSAAVMAQLAQLPGIVGAKISGASSQRLLDYRSAVPDDFVLYTGDDRQIARTEAIGAQGVVSGIASALPGPFTAMAALLATGVEQVRIAAAQTAIDEVVDGVAGDIARIKAALRLQNVRAGYPRMSIEEPSDAESNTLRGLVERYREA